MTRIIHVSAKGTKAFTPNSFLSDDPPPKNPPTFTLLVPTFAQRDTLSSLLFHHGCMPMTRDHGRSVLISELYNVFYPEDDPVWSSQPIPANIQRGDPDEIANFLEGYWQQAEIYEEICVQWGLQERERILDRLGGAEETPGVPMPAPPYPARDTARAKRISLEMLEWSVPYRECQAQFADYDSREDLMLFRLFCDGWDGSTAFTVPVVKDGTGKLTEDCVEQLREELAGLLGTDNAYKEVVIEIRAMMSLDKEQEKNSESPPGSSSSPSGLSAESAELGDGDGPWTGSNTERTPPAESPPTSSTSSNSRSGAGKSKGRGGRTGKA